jgi:hypothetical protein
MARHWWIWLSLLACGLLVITCVYDRVELIAWVGATDLDVEFVITDADSGAPLPGARVEIHSEGGLLAHEESKGDFVLIVDEDGVAQKARPRCMCHGDRSGLGFTNSFAIHTPWWRFRAVAAGYETPEWAWLDSIDHSRQLQRLGPGRTKLVVPISLTKREK